MKTVAFGNLCFFTDVYLTMVLLDRTKVKVQLLHAGDGVTVLGRGTKGPGLQGADHAGFDAVTKGMQNGQIGDLAAGIDGDIDDHVALNPMGKRREVGRRAGGVGGEGYLDRA